MSALDGEDVAIYQAELHNDLAKLTCEVARIAEMLALLIDGERALSVRQAGSWITREDRP